MRPVRSIALTALFRGALLLTTMAAASELGLLSESERSFLASARASMRTMMTDMAISPKGDVDQDFIAQMIPHHRGAIDMAKAELLYGHNEQLHRIAQEIVVEQQAQIAVMQREQTLPHANAANTGGN